MTAATPAAAAVSIESGNGKKASEASTEPPTRSPAFLMAISTESTRLIWPAPAPSSMRSLAQHDGVGLHVPHHRPGEAQIGHLGRRSAGVSVTTFHSLLGVGQHVGLLHEHAAVEAAVGPMRLRRRSIWPTSISRTLAFHLGLVVRISRASASKSGATIASTNRPGSASTSAVAASTVRFSPSTEPKALSGSPSIARCKAVGQRVGHGGAAGIVVLDHHGGRLGEIADDRQRAVEVEQVVVRKLLAVQLPGGDDAGPVAVGPRRRGPPAGAGSRRSAAPSCACRPMVIVPGNGPSAVVAGEEVGDGPIVAGRVGEGLAGQPAAQLQRRAAVGR